MLSMQEMLNPSTDADRETTADHGETEARESAARVPLEQTSAPDDLAPVRRSDPATYLKLLARQELGRGSQSFDYKLYCDRGYVEDVWNIFAIPSNGRNDPSCTLKVLEDFIERHRSSIRFQSLVGLDPAIRQFASGKGFWTVGLRSRNLEDTKQLSATEVRYNLLDGYKERASTVGVHPESVSSLIELREPQISSNDP